MRHNPYPKWQRLGYKTAYKGNTHIIVHDAKLPTGQQTTYEVHHADGGKVAVLMKTSNNQIILMRRYRFPIDRWIYDLPTSDFCTSEKLENIATQVCYEEVGVRPKEFVQLTTFCPNPGAIDWTIDTFFCAEIEESELKIKDDSSSTSEVVLMPVDEFDQLVQNREIVDPSLLIAWYATKEKELV